MNYQFETYKGDFLPLTDDYSIGGTLYNKSKEIDIWSGYYSSKPVYK